MKKLTLAGLAVSALALLYLLTQVYTYFGAAATAGAAAGSIIVLGLIFLCVKKKPVIALILELLMILLLSTTLFGVHEVNEVTEEISQTVEYETVQLVALKDSGITAEDDFSNYVAGYVNGDEHAFTCLSEIIKENNKKLSKSRPCKSTGALYDRFKKEKLQLMILTNDIKTDLSVIDEDYEEKIIVLFEKKYPLSTATLKPVDIETEPFTLYICGADLSSGQTITSTGRGDVNILLTVNPNTKKVNLQVIPRDTFVYIPCRDGRSKLSYSGWWGGVQSSIQSIEDKFGIDINYYAKLNFNGLTDLVDALGGVTVYSHYTYSSGGFSFVEGENFVDGEKALVFARARKMLPENELSRGYHQMELIKGIFRKFAEDPTYDKAMAILDGLSSNFVTNLPKKDFKKAFNLVVSLLPELQNMENHTIEGTYEWHYDEVRTEYYQYYYYPAEGEVEAVRKRIEKVLTGE